jgi:hypothetical protein
VNKQEKSWILVKIAYCTSKPELFASKKKQGWAGGLGQTKEQGCAG